MALRWRARLAVAGVVALGLLWARHDAGSLGAMWLTPDQRGALLLGRGDAAAAAGHFRDPAWRGVALYRAGAFADAAAEWGRVGGADAAFDRGNALVMSGKYDGAIASYDAALAIRPDWKAARANRAVAAARRDALAPPADDEGGTGGREKPDAIVLDGPRNAGGPAEPSDASAGADDAGQQALWLRRVQTTPGDFLRAKFAFQASRRPAAGTPPAEAAP
ncbi:MAG: tetratricopeptide repeat protein [bacterium]|nr:tetratricopeptide repeat protein [bacterium]